MDYTKFDEIVRTINEKLGAFHQVGVLRDWNHRITDDDVPNDALFSGESQVVQPGHTWSSAIGKAWFWREFTLPEETNGVSLAGSAVDFIFIFPIGATIYLNGKQVYHEPFWADTRSIELRIIESCKPGEKNFMAIKAKSGDGFGLFLDTTLRVDTIAKVALALERFREQIGFCRYLLEKKPDEKLQNLLAETVELVDVQALKDNNWDKWNQSTAAAVEKLMPFNKQAKEFEVNLVAHSHIDMNWLWPWTETVEVCRRDFTSMDSLMEKYPEFKFSQSQVSVYKAMGDYHPEVLEQIKERVKSGQWDITASTWVEGDLNTALGETLVRQILHSKRYLRKNFGMEPKICWEPDTFGHPATYPQILKKSGIDYYYFCRAGKGHPMFWWEAPDGSRVQAYNDFYGYGGFVTPASAVLGTKPMFEHLGLKTSLFVYGVGDHGGAATELDIQQALEIAETPLLPRTRMSGVSEFHDKIAATGIDYPVVQDELNTIFEGCYSSHGDIKWLNRYGESSLLTAETMASLAAIDSGKSYPIEPLADAWKNQCFHQFHDILCGCSIGSTYVEAAESLTPSHDTLRSVIADSASSLAHNVKTGSDGAKKIVVFNQLAWGRTDVVEVPVDSLGLNFVGAIKVTDETGAESPAQVMDGKLVFVAKGVPSLGCKVYSFATSDAPAATTIKVDAPNNVIENEFMRVKVNPNSGAIDSLVLKEIGREMAGPSAGWGVEGKVNAGMLNRFIIQFEQPHPMSAWNIGDITGSKSLISGAEVKVVETGPACAAIEVKHKFLNSSLKQQIRVYAGLNRVDFVTEVDWHEKGTAMEDAPMLKATFTPFLGNSKAVYEIPYGAIERTADGREVPALRWADMSDDKCGLSLLNNCKYGHSAQGNTLALTLVRASYEPDNNPDEGLHHFTYSLVPHAGNWQDAGTMLKGSELNQPLVATTENAHDGAILPGEAYLACEPASVVVSAVKFAEDQSEDANIVIVRLFESKGESVKAVFNTKWVVSKAEEVNMLEEQGKPLSVNGNSVDLSFGKHEIKTVKLYVKR